jgi:hypothetical protein
VITARGGLRDLQENSSMSNILTRALLGSVLTLGAAAGAQAAAEGDQFGGFAGFGAFSTVGQAGAFSAFGGRAESYASGAAGLTFNRVGGSTGFLGFQDNQAGAQTWGNGQAFGNAQGIAQGFAAGGVVRNTRFGSR